MPRQAIIFILRGASRAWQVRVRVGNSLSCRSQMHEKIESEWDRMVVLRVQLLVAVSGWRGSARRWSDPAPPWPERLTKTPALYHPPP